MSFTVFAAAPVLRDQLDLSSTWNSGLVVPNQFDWSARDYQRSVTVPSGWSGKRIVLYLEQWNYGGQVYINGQLDTTLWGSCTPFNVDISDRVSAGQTFTIRLATRATDAAGMRDGSGRWLWPMGCSWWQGLRGDVFLRAYGQVCIEDAYIRTSVRAATITVDYTIVNHTASSKTVSIAAEASPWPSGAVAKSLSAGPVTLAVGERRVVTATVSWPDAALWQPGSPNLYTLVSSVRENTTVLDQETRRFGFREVWISGNQYRLNGVRMNLRGESSYFHWPLIYYDFYDNGTPERFFNKQTFAATVDTFMKVLNMNMYRFHAMPALAYQLDICDEKGFLLQDESAMYGLRNTFNHLNGILDTVRNHHIPQWIKAHRNHPSIVIWSAENEGFLWDITNAEMKSLGDRIRDFDRTRPILYDGDAGVADSTKTYHYPEGYGNIPTGNIYGLWLSRVESNRPCGLGEFITSYANADPFRGALAERVWAHVIWTRGCRYINFADIRPYTIEWAWTDSLYPVARKAMANSYAPVALYDKTYDSLGTAPRMNNAFPSLTAGSTVNRTLILYNDEFADTVVTIEVLVMTGTTERARGARIFDQTLGNHRDIPVSFQVPFVGGSTMDLVLRTRKNGVKKFEESLRFNVTGTSTGSSSNTVTITGGRPTDPVGVAQPAAQGAPVRAADRSAQEFTVRGQHIASSSDSRGATAQVIVTRPHQEAGRASLRTRVKR